MTRSGNHTLPTIESGNRSPHSRNRPRPRAVHAVVVVTVLLASVLSAVGSARAAQPLPLPERIDQLVERELTRRGAKPAAIADDYEFARRLYLDLAGRIPTRDELARFCDNQAPAKREQLIERLLKGPEFPQRLSEFYHVMLMERRGENEHWRKFLLNAAENNLPWNAIAAAILHPDPELDERQGAGYFYTARLVSEGAMAPIDYPAVTRDVARLFAGMDLQCAQCHDHLTVDHYRQADFQGLHVIFKNLATRRDVEFPAVSQQVVNAAHEFSSVFDQIPMTTGVRVPGAGEVPIPTFEKDEQYEIPPDRKTKHPGVPKFQMLNILANRLCSSENLPFRNNIVNRLWFLMMGRGLVEPLDLHHPDNPATHPELLALLGEELVAHGWDVRWLLGQIARTRAYQRTSVVSAGSGGGDEGVANPQLYAVANEKRLSAEQLYWSTLQALGFAAGRVGDPSEQVSEEDLEQLRGLFLESFANPPKEPEETFEPTVKAALFLMNDQRVLRLLEPSASGLVEQLAAETDDRAVIERLYLTVLSRPPDDSELGDLQDFLAAAEDRPAALGKIAWALVTSTEFGVNH